jgi:hypothetical protein
VAKALAAKASLLRQDGPRPGRPHADTLTGSQFANMKELRLTVDNGVWRVADAFGPVDKPSFSSPETKPVPHSGDFMKT